MGEIAAAGGGPVSAPTSQRLDAGWLEAILEAVPDFHDADERTATKTAAHFKWALGYLQSRDVPEWGEVTPPRSLEWCWAGTRGRDGKPRRPEVSTARNRQWTLRLMYTVAAALGAEVDPRTAAGEPIKRTPPNVRSRPLTDMEDREVCAYGDSGAVPTMKSMAVAMVRTGASAQEVPYVRRRDVDLDAATVTLRGPNARTCPMDTWSVETVERYLRAHLVDPDDLLCVRSVAVPERAAQSVTVQLNKVLRDAGFANHPDISGRSLRLTAARRAFKRGGIAAAAHVLGSPSLDATAEAIGWRWRDEGDLAEVLGRNRWIAQPTDPPTDPSDVDSADASTPPTGVGHG